jgi:hypothetical protein
MTLHAMRVVAIMVRMLRFVDFCKKVAGEETNRQKEMRFDDLFLTKVSKTVCPATHTFRVPYVCMSQLGLIVGRHLVDSWSISSNKYRRSIVGR